MITHVRDSAEVYLRAAERRSACLLEWTIKTRKKVHRMMLFLGFVTILLNLGGDAMANNGNGIVYNGEQLDEATRTVLTYLEGSFGALIFTAAGVGSIVSAAFGQYRASLSLMVVGLGAFILRSFLETFFNTVGMNQR